MLIFQKGKHGPDKFNIVRFANAPQNSQLARASATVQVNLSVFNAGPIAQVSVLLFHFSIPTNYSEHNPKQSNLKLCTLFSGKAGGEKKGQGQYERAKTANQTGSYNRTLVA